MNKASIATTGNRRAFTLIELLIVVGIVGILAAIAVPNLLEAQTRAKVSRVSNDMRSLATALEAYQVDFGRYPFAQSFIQPSPLQKLRQLTTPIAFMTSIPSDPFNDGRTNVISRLLPFERTDTYLYNTGVASIGLGGSQTAADRAQAWSLTSVGPDREFAWVYYAFDDSFIADNRYILLIYDPTNGTVSAGDIFRRGGFVARQTPGVLTR